jgi:hypothetical protein
MRRFFGLVVGALLLGIIGGACLVAGRFERRMGIAQEDMAVLDFEDPQAEYVILQQEAEKVPWVSRATLADIRGRRAALQYWQGNYAELMETGRTAAQRDEPPDADLLLLAANASYRAAQRGPQDKATLLKSLDDVIRAYNEALRAGGERADASFNYELAVRLRAEIAGGKRKAMPIDEAAEEKGDTNLHGSPGEPPKDMKTEQFKIRVPMDPKNFKNSQEEAGTGQARKRRG